MEIVARGVRNTVGFDWHPVTKELWFTDNGRDWAGNAGPEDELNVHRQGQGGRLLRLPVLPRQRRRPIRTSRSPNPCAGVTLPAALTGPHSAGLGIKFYTGNMFPKSYQNVAFIARRGSWNREQKFGYDVVVARTSGGKAKIEPFLTGLLDEKANTFHGRPTYVHQMKDGSLLVSDEQNGAIYRITYQAQDGQPVNAERWNLSRKHGRPLIFGLAAVAFCAGAALAQGGPLAERIQTCAACHGEDGNSRMENIPSIAGQPAFFIVNQLILMRERRAAGRGDGAVRQGSQGR